jgi:hypothetical protein
VLHDIRECACWKGDHGRTASQRFHGDKRTGLWYQTGHEQATRSRQQTLFADSAYRPYKAAYAIQAWDNLMLKILLMSRIAKYLTSQQGWHVGTSCSVKCDVKAFFRANPSEHESKVLLAILGRARCHWYAILNIWQQHRLWWAGPPLHCRDTMQKGLWPVQVENLHWIPGWWEMQGDEYRHARWRQVRIEVNAMHVHKVDGPALQRPGDRPVVLLLGLLSHLFVQRLALRRSGDERAGRD